MWLNTLTAFILGLFLLKRIKTNREKNFLRLLFFFTLFYILFALSFPTWTIPRYGIPLYFALFSLLALSLSRIASRVLYACILTCLLTVTLAANFFSIDPVMAHSVGTVSVQNERLYNLPFWDNSPDRVTYNTQFLSLVKNQNQFIQKVIKSNADVVITYCDELKLGEKIYSLSVYNTFYPDLQLHKPLICINAYALTPQTAKKTENKIIYLRKNESADIISILAQKNVHPAKIITGDN